MVGTKKVRRKKASEAASRGLLPADSRSRFAEAPAAVAALGRAIEADGGAVLSTYRDPLGGHWQVLAVLPAEQVEPTPFQRDIS